MNSTSLAVVVPVYNEEKNIVSLFNDWNKLFADNKIDALFIFINDGSTDSSMDKLNQLIAANKNVSIINKQNSGHGPSILKGYEMVLDYEWIFQIDSDHQYDTAPFLILWEKRKTYDFLIGERNEINASPFRKIISSVCSSSVKLFYRNKIKDINVPYRLMSGTVLREFLGEVPANCFAPNVLLSVFAIKKQKRIFITPINFRSNIQPNRSRFSSKIFFGSLQTFWYLFK